MLIPYNGPHSVQEFNSSADVAGMQAGFAETPEGVNWARVFSALVRYKWLILLVVAVGAAGGVVSTRVMAPEYQVGATIFIADGGGQPADRNGPIRASSLLQSAGWVELL